MLKGKTLKKIKILLHWCSAILQKYAKLTNRSFDVNPYPPYVNVLFSNKEKFGLFMPNYL